MKYLLAAALLLIASPCYAAWPPISQDGQGRNYIATGDLAMLTPGEAPEFWDWLSGYQQFSWAMGYPPDWPPLYLGFPGGIELPGGAIPPVKP